MKVNADPWCSAYQASAIAGCSRLAIITAVARGSLTGKEFAGRLLILRADVERFVFVRGSRRDSKRQLAG